ncbi:MAG: hypothetical protein DCC49_07450 [Acidobacteria bacterium]|nr:MAG: hypothetical protein DCC49_07450 [Acidobacteriota bacterium]
MIDVLLLEDSSDDAALLSAELRRSGFEATIRRVDERSDFLDELNDPPEIIVADNHLPQYCALEALEDVRERDKSIPFIIFSGAIEEETAIEALKKGADDFVMKDRPRRLATAIQFALDRAAKRAREQEDAEAMRAMVDALQSLSEQRRRLLDRLASAQEDERRRIAGNVHDDHIQMMTAISLRIQLLAEDLSRPDVKEELEEITDLLAQGITRLRRFIFDLYPDSLIDEGLAKTLRPYIETLSEEWGIRIEIAIRHDGEPDRDIEVIAFRILQEALTNVHKHAEANRIEIEAMIAASGTRFVIEDDGCGIGAPVPSDPSHIGLRTMRDRAELAGGFLEIGEASIGGTRVEYWIPSGEVKGVASAHVESGSDGSGRIDAPCMEIKKSSMF